MAKTTKTGAPFTFGDGLEAPKNAAAIEKACRQEFPEASALEVVRVGPTTVGLNVSTPAMVKDKKTGKQVLTSRVDFYKVPLT